MRLSLHNLFGQAIALRYRLPVDTQKGRITPTVVSTHGDKCLVETQSDIDISSLIYNGIVEYAFNDYEIYFNNLDNMQLRAFQNKLKYNPTAPMSTQIGYGFHAEVLLHLILDYFYSARKCIARGYMYSPLENSEIKGYDSYVMVEDPTGKIYLLFGEAKAYIQGYKESVNSIFESIEKALSDDYLKKNFLAMENVYEKVNPQSRIPAIIDAWRINPAINMAEEAEKYNMELVYPMFIMYDDKGVTYEERIMKVVNYINTSYPKVNATLTIPHTLFFIFLPVENCREVKRKVVEWISQKQPVMP